MGKLWSFLRSARNFAPRLRGCNSVIFYPISKNKVSYYPNAQETPTMPQIPHIHGFEQF